jgi:hypothetical protein
VAHHLRAVSNGLEDADVGSHAPEGAESIDRRAEGEVRGFSGKASTGSQQPAAVSVGPTAEDRATYPSLASALKPAKSTFRAVAQARMYSKGPFQSSPELREAMERFYPRLTRAFERRHGVAQYHWCDHAPAAAALTYRRRIWRVNTQLWLFVNPCGRWAQGEKALSDCEILKDEIEDTLRGTSRRRCLQMVFAVVTTALAVLDERAREPASPTAVESGSNAPTRLERARQWVTTIRRRSSRRDRAPAVDAVTTDLLRRLESVRMQYEREARRSMQLVHLGGMLAWTAVVATLTVGMLGLSDSSIAQELGLDGDGARRAATCALSGTVGAFVSVMLRMTQDQGVDVDLSVGRKMGHLLGAARPLIGAVSGIIVYLLLASGLVPLGTDEPARLDALYAVVALAAGFTERMVPDMLGIASKQLSPRA